MGGCNYIETQYCVGPHIQSRLAGDRTQNARRFSGRSLISGGICNELIHQKTKDTDIARRIPAMSPGDSGDNI